MISCILNEWIHFIPTAVARLHRVVCALILSCSGASIKARATPTTSGTRTSTSTAPPTTCSACGLNGVNESKLKAALCLGLRAST